MAGAIGFFVMMANAVVIGLIAMIAFALLVGAFVLLVRGLIALGAAFENGD